MRIHHRTEWLESGAEVHRNAFPIPSGAQRKIFFLLADRCLDQFSKSCGRLEEMGRLRSLFLPDTTCEVHEANRTAIGGFASCTATGLRGLRCCGNSRIVEISTHAKVNENDSFNGEP